MPTGIQKRLPRGYRVNRIDDHHMQEEYQSAEKAIADYNRPFLGNSALIPLALNLQDENGVTRARLCASMTDGWLYLNILWVDANFRRQGFGRVLMLCAEAHARQQGCHPA